MSRHFPPIRRDTATRWPNSATTGILRAMSARFSRAEVTTPTVVAVPTDTMSGSDVLIPSTGRSSATPTTRSRRFTSTDIFIRTSGRVPGGPTTRPTRPSAFVRTGSRFVPIAMSPPGRTSFRAAPPLWRERTIVVRFFHSVRLPTVTCRPGEISISSPTFALPCIRLPPRTPPTIFSGGIPGWFTSKDRATYIFGLRFLARPRRDHLLDHHEQDVQVHIVVGAHGDDRRALGDGPLDERLNLLVVLLGLLRVDDVDLVLHDHDLVDADNPEGHQVLLRLRLRDVLVRRDHEQGAVHDRRAAQHRRHERLMSGRVDEGHDPLELPLHVVGLAHLRVLVRGGLVVLRTLVDRHVRVAQADRDASLDLLAVPVRPLPGEPLRQRGLPMVHVPDDADVHLRLTRDLHRACSCHASSIDLGPRTTIFRFSCRMSGDTVFPRTVFFFRIPGRTGWNPTPPLTSRL